MVPIERPDWNARQGQLDLLEARIGHAVLGALREWTTAVRGRLLGSALTAAAGDGDSNGGLAPDPTIAARMAAIWAALVASHITPVVATQVTRVMTEELAHDAAQLAEHDVNAQELLLQTRSWQAAFVGSLPNRLADIPNETFALLQSDLQLGIERGLSTPTVRDMMARTLSVRVGGAANDWRTRAQLIARTLSTASLNGGLVQAWGARNAAVGMTTYKEWLSALDNRTREWHAAADSQVVALDEDFSVGGEQMAYPGDPRGSTANTANCRCVVGESADGTSTRSLTASAQPCAPVDAALLSWAPTPTDPAAEAVAVFNPGVVRDRDAVLAAAGGNTTMAGKAQTWSGLLAPIGVNSGDRRRLAAGGTFTHRDLPLPIMYQAATGDGHDGSTVVGRILTVTIGEGPEGLGYYGTGDFLIGEQFAGEVARAVELVSNGLGHISVDLADVVAELVDADGNPVDEQALMAAWEAGQDLEVYDQFQQATLIGATLVAKPAFAQAIISLDGAAPIERVPDMAALERAAAAEAEAAAGGSDDEGDDSGDSDIDANLTDSDGTPIEVGDRVSAVVGADDSDDSADAAGAPFDPDNDGDDDSSPEGDTDGDAVQGTVTAVDVEADAVTIQPDDAEAAPVVAKSADVKVLEKADEGDEDSPSTGDGGGVPPSPYANDAAAQAAAEAEDVVAEAEGYLVDADAQVASLAAAAGVLVDFRPDAEYFANPSLSALTPMTVGPADENGYRRVFGHVAGWKSCHIGFSRECVTPPKEDDFAYFHIGEVTLADGSDLAVGNLTLGGRHADGRAAYRDAVEHYDDSGAGVAVVRAYADEYGIAVSGVITPETSELQIGQLRRSGLSGDWRRIGAELRLVGALAVNTGGFPVPRYATDGTGRILSLVAAGSVPQALKVEESFEEVARRVFADERAKEARRVEVAALVASASAVAEAVNKAEVDELLAGLDLSLEA